MLGLNFHHQQKGGYMTDTNLPAYIQQFSERALTTRVVDVQQVQALAIVPEHFLKGTMAERLHPQALEADDM